MSDGNTFGQVPLLIGGEWRPEAALPQGSVVNPAIGQQIASVPLCGKAQVDEAVVAASAAFPAWSDVPPV
jgi:malonate-semialdehyde dehydrogenase (acetylating)/methylmalonate-semialdehyde dehydrogenase